MAGATFRCVLCGLTRVTSGSRRSSNRDPQFGDRKQTKNCYLQLGDYFKAALSEGCNFVRTKPCCTYLAIERRKAWDLTEGSSRGGSKPFAAAIPLDRAKDSYPTRHL